MPVTEAERRSFTAFVTEIQDRVRYALVASHGPQRGLEASAEAFSYAWEHWGKVEAMENPAGYVFRVGQRIARRRERRIPLLFPPAPMEMPWVEPGLPKALGGLSERQRVVVVLVHGFGLSQREVAALLGVSAGSVQRHLERGLAKLRSALGVEKSA